MITALAVAGVDPGAWRSNGRPATLVLPDAPALLDWDLLEAFLAAAPPNWRLFVAGAVFERLRALERSASASLAGRARHLLRLLDREQSLPARERRVWVDAMGKADVLRTCGQLLTGLAGRGRVMVVAGQVGDKLRYRAALEHRGPAAQVTWAGELQALGLRRRRHSSLKAGGGARRPLPLLLVRAGYLFAGCLSSVFAVALSLGLLPPWPAEPVPLCLLVWLVSAGISIWGARALGRWSGAWPVNGALTRLTGGVAPQQRVFFLAGLVCMVGSGGLLVAVWLRG